MIYFYFPTDWSNFILRNADDNSDGKRRVSIFFLLGCGHFFVVVLKNERNHGTNEIIWWAAGDSLPWRIANVRNSRTCVKGTHRRRCAHPHADTPINIGLYRVCTPTVATISLPVYQPHLPRSLRRRRRHLHPLAEERHVVWSAASEYAQTDLPLYTPPLAERQHERKNLKGTLKEERSRWIWSHNLISGQIKNIQIERCI